jgi:riboflavin kinase/FMN adenylyltransferase
MARHDVKLFRDLTALPGDLRGGAVAIGNFDGVHRGHAAIVQQLVARARQVGGPAIVFTFDPHPVQLLRPREAPPPLTGTERKTELLGRLGVDAVVAYPTDEALLRLTPEEFFDQIVRGRLSARGMVEGQNFFFGHDRAGTIDVLRQLCRGIDIPVDVVEPVLIDAEPVSSSRVRRLLAAGEIDGAGRLLTEPYQIRGKVVHGAGRGAQLGFPTANVTGISTLLPGLGVYAGRARAEGDLWPAAINVGPNPTFGEQALKVEVHLIGFEQSLYDQPLKVDFQHRLRDIQRFNDVAALTAQVQRDVVAAREYFAAGGGNET